MYWVGRGGKDWELMLQEYEGLSWGRNLKETYHFKTYQFKRNISSWPDAMHH